jgi:GAF domain-containing protein
MLDNAVHICQAKFGFMNRYDGDAWKIIAVHGAAPAYTEYLQQHGYKRPGPETVSARIATTKQMVHIADLVASRGYIERDPVVVAAVELGGVRTLLGVPMLKEDELIGSILLYRQEVRPFTDKQIELVKNFASQAVIAIENARLLHELRQSLEQQTATSEVLRVISSSPGDLEPVFETIVENATRICEASFGSLFRFDGKVFYLVAEVGTPQELIEAQRQGLLTGPTPGGLFDRAMRTKQVIHTADATKEGVVGLAAKFGGARSQICVPMLKDDDLIGAILIYRQEVRPFTDKQIELVKNFASQAVIAIENARLLKDLRESLDRQTATADILRVIASTPEDSKRALDTIAETAARMFNAASVHFRRIEGGVLRMIGAAGPFAARVRDTLPDQPLDEPTDPAVRCYLDNRQIVIEDRRIGLPNVVGPIARVLHELPVGSQVFTPLSRQGEAIGLMIVTRNEVGPFKQDELDLMKGFADQAVIAIENARLLNELRESLQQQIATADVLKIISRSTFDLKAVLRTLVESATHVCEADIGNIALRHLSNRGGLCAISGARRGAEAAETQARTRQFDRPDCAQSLNNTYSRRPN